MSTNILQERMHEANIPQMPDPQIPSARSEGGTSPEQTAALRCSYDSDRGPRSTFPALRAYDRAPSPGTGLQEAGSAPAVRRNRAGRPRLGPQPRQAPTPTRLPSGAAEASGQSGLTSSQREEPPARAERREEAATQRTAKPRRGAAHLPADVATFRAAPRACAGGDGRGVKLHVAASPASPLRGRGHAGKGRGGM